MSEMTGPVRIRLVCCIGMQQDTSTWGLAMTAIRWITSQIRYEGSARRDKVIEEASQLGMGELDELYAFILDRIPPPPEDHEARERYLKGLKTVLGCLVVLQKPLGIGTIIMLLSLSPDDFDVPHCMKRISSLIVDRVSGLDATSRMEERGPLWYQTSISL